MKNFNTGDRRGGGGFRGGDRGGYRGGDRGGDRGYGRVRIFYFYCLQGGAYYQGEQRSAQAQPEYDEDYYG